MPDPYGAFGFHWVLRDRTGDLTGMAGLALGAIGTRPSGVPGRGDVGYWLGRPYWRQGLMSEALGGLIGVCASEFDYAKVDRPQDLDDVGQGGELDGRVVATRRRRPPGSAGSS